VKARREHVYERVNTREQLILYGGREVSCSLSRKCLFHGRLLRITDIDPSFVDLSLYGTLIKALTTNTLRRYDYYFEPTLTFACEFVGSSATLTSGFKVPFVPYHHP
jgi:hypothetical protein